MGEIAEMMLDGTLCTSCGTLLIEEGEEPEGYPQYCDLCRVLMAEADRERTAAE